MGTVFPKWEREYFSRNKRQSRPTAPEEECQPESGKDASGGVRPDNDSSPHKEKKH